MFPENALSLITQVLNKRQCQQGTLWEKAENLAFSRKMTQRGTPRQQGTES